MAAHDSGAAVVQTLHNGRWLCLEGGFYRSSSYCDKCVGRSGLNGVYHGCKHGVIPSAFLHTSNALAWSCGQLFRWVDQFIAVSDFIKQQHLLAGFSEDKIVVKNNGIDVDFLNIIPSSKREGVAFVGRINEAKGINILNSSLIIRSCLSKLWVWSRS